MEQLKKKYQAEADLMGSKSRFGFFSIPPSHAAAKTDYVEKKAHKTADGRVEIQNRNIYSGIPSSGILKKSYFSVPKSIYHGDPYDKPHNISSNNFLSKDGEFNVYKPAKLNKTLAWPAYKYVCQNPPPQKPKRNRRQDGSVVTQLRNICSNSLSKINSQNEKKFKYSPCQYDNQRKLKNKQLLNSISMRRGQGPFKTGKPVKDCFSTNAQTYSDHQLKKIKQKSLTLNKKIVNHQSAFRPSCTSKINLFSYPKHMSDNYPKIVKKKFPKQQQPFKVSNKRQSSKPSPSISCLKTNLLRKVR